jgi:hypothetical protein
VRAGRAGGGAPRTPSVGWVPELPSLGRFARGELTIRGPREAPEFHDEKGRRIGPNGRVEEGPDGGGGPRAPP